MAGKLHRAAPGAAFLATIARTMSIARRIKVIEASSVRNAACEVSVTFSMRASG